MRELKFPKHDAGLHLEHNPHKNVYETIEEYEHQNEDCWVSQEEKKKAIETNDYWRLQWYPDTPVGFYVLMAHNLEALLEAASKDTP